MAFKLSVRVTEDIDSGTWGKTRMFIHKSKRIRGLKLSVKPGDIVEINGTEILIQFIGSKNSYGRIAIFCDPEKFYVSRNESRRAQVTTDYEDPS